MSPYTLYQALRHVPALSLGIINGAEHMTLESKTKKIPRVAVETPGTVWHLCDTIYLVNTTASQN